MTKLRQTGQTGQARRWISLAAWGAFGLAAQLATGCSTPQMAGTQPPPDPLMGHRSPPGMPLPNTNTPAASATSVPPSSQTYQQGPAPLTIPTSSNPASLAATTWQGPLGRPLAIDDNNSTGPGFLPGQLTSSRTQRTDGLPPNPNPKVEIVPDIHQTPQQINPTGSWQNQQPINATPNANADGLTRQLQERGVIQQKQEPAPEGVRLTCYVSRGPEGGLRILEVAASDYATAAQAILRQLDAAR